MLGGGIGGWDDFEENLVVVRGSFVSNTRLLMVADSYARNLATRLNLRYFNLEKVRQIESAEQKLLDDKKTLVSLTS